MDDQEHFSTQDDRGAAPDGGKPDYSAHFITGPTHELAYAAFMECNADGLPTNLAAIQNAVQRGKRRTKRH